MIRFGIRGLSAAIGLGLASLSTTAAAQAWSAGKWYFNIHTSAFSGGEIRGFTTVVPEPSTVVLLAGGLAAVGFGAADVAMPFPYRMRRPQPNQIGARQPPKKD